MSDDKDAKHAEIARRYNWQRQQSNKVTSLLRTVEMVRLFRHRLGGELSRGELDKRIMAAAGTNWTSSSAWLIGQKISLTLAERMLLDIRTMWPSDKTRSEVKWAYAERKRERDRKYRRRTRAQKMEATKMYHDLSERQETLFAILRGNGKWLTTRQMAGMVRDWSAWRCPNGSRLKRTSLIHIVRSELNVLHSQGMTEQNRKITRAGALETRHRIAQKPPKSQLNAVNPKIVAPKNAKSADKMPCESGERILSLHRENHVVSPLTDETTKNFGDFREAVKRSCGGRELPGRQCAPAAPQPPAKP